MIRDLSSLWNLCFLQFLLGRLPQEEALDYNSSYVTQILLNTLLSLNSVFQTLGSFYHSNSLCKLLINFFFLPFPCLHTNYHTFKLNQYYLVIRGLSFWLRLIAKYNKEHSTLFGNVCFTLSAIC